MVCESQKTNKHENTSKIYITNRKAYLHVANSSI